MRSGREDDPSATILLREPLEEICVLRRCMPAEGSALIVEPRLLPLNAWIALHQGGGGWTPRFAQLGFVVRGYELPINASRARQIVADGVSVHDSRRIVMLCESKCGANVSESQAETYGAITPEDVARTMSLDGPLDAWRVIVLFACLVEHEERIAMGMAKAKLAPVRMSLGTSTVEFRGAGRLLRKFTQEIPGPPPGIVRIDADSPMEEFLEVLQPEVVAAIARGETTISADALLQRLGTYGPSGRAARGKMRKVAKEALASLVEQSRWKKRLKIAKGGSEHDGFVINVTRSPKTLDPRGETQSWQALQRAGAEALRGTPPAAQLTLGNLDPIWDLADDLDPEESAP